MLQANVLANNEMDWQQQVVVVTTAGDAATVAGLDIVFGQVDCLL